jgi:hypothetical protein
MDRIEAEVDNYRRKGVVEENSGRKRKLRCDA